MLKRIRRNHRPMNHRPVGFSCILLVLCLLGPFLLVLPLASGSFTSWSNHSGGATHDKSPNGADNDGPIIGIDLGTTYSCVSVYRNGQAEIIANDQGNRITPSYVAFSDTGDRWIGDAAKNQATVHPHSTVFDVKRLIGRKFSDPLVQADKKLLPYTITGDAKDRPMIQVHDQLYAPEEISAMILRRMKETAEAYLGQPVHRAVITVPVAYRASIACLVVGSCL